MEAEEYPAKPIHIELSESLLTGEGVHVEGVEYLALQVTPISAVTAVKVGETATGVLA